MSIDDQPVRVTVVLPAHLRTLAAVPGHVEVQVIGEVTLDAVLTALEQAHPVLRGTTRDTATGRRRAHVRFFACEQDLSHDDPASLLPEPVRAGREPLLVVGAMAGG